MFCTCRILVFEVLVFEPNGLGSKIRKMVGIGMYSVGMGWQARESVFGSNVAGIGIYCVIYSVGMG